MKHISRFASLLAMGLLATSILTGCNHESNLPNDTLPGTEAPTEAPTEAATISCTVTVVDYAGTPMADVVVAVLKDGEQVKMNVSKADGTANFKLEPDTYEVTVTSSTGAVQPAVLHLCQ